MSEASLSPGVGRLVLPGARGTCTVILFLEEENCDPAQAAAFVCVCSKHPPAEITFSKAQIRLPESQWQNECLDVCGLWPRGGFWENNGSTADVWTGNAHSTAAFWPTAWPFWGPSLIFQPLDATTDFLMCIVASSEQRPRERGALRHSSFPSSPQLWWRQPVSPCYFLASVPSQQSDALSEH